MKMVELNEKKFELEIPNGDNYNHPANILTI